MKRLFVCFFTLLLIAGCNKEGDKVLVIHLDRSTLELCLTDIHQLVVTHEPADLPAPVYQWSSSNSGVVTVSENGLVTAVGEGSATITVSSLGTQLFATCAVTVAKQLATQITLDRETLSIEWGQSEILSFSLLPEGAILSSPKWSSSDEEVATVDRDGRVTAVSVGEAEVIILDEDRPEVKASCAVTVIRPDATEIVLNITELVIQKNDIEVLTYSSLPQFSLIESVVWSSSNEAIATVDSQGKVTAVEEGTVEISVTDAFHPNLKAVCAVTVISIIVTDISFLSDEEELFVGDWIALNYIVQPQGARLSQPEWSSSSPLVASVDPTGRVTGFSKGTAIITLCDKETPHLFAACTVQVFDVEATSIQINPTTLTLITQEQATLTCQIEPQNTTNKEVVWSSDNEAVAVVDPFGKVTAVAAGECNIIVRLKNGALSSSCQVKVVVPIASIALDRVSLEMRRGDTHPLRVSYLPNDAMPPAAYHWSSSDEWVATVDQEGNIEALRMGTTTIRVDISGGLYATCTVTVVPVYTNWSAPALLFGGSITNIIIAEGRFINSALTNFTSGQALVYDGEIGSRLQYCVYAFDGGRMAASLLAFADDDPVAIAAARGFCEERYKYVLESNGITVYQDRDGTHIEVGFRNLTEYVSVTALQLSMLGLKNRWFIVSYAR